MRITKRKLRKLIQERLSAQKVKLNVQEIGSKPNGASLDLIESMYGDAGLNAVDELVADGMGALGRGGVFYSRRSPGYSSNLAESAFLIETKILPILVNPYEDLDTMNRVANYALTNDIQGALADKMVNYENLDLDLDEMQGWVQFVGKDDGHFSEEAVVPDNWDLDKVYKFMKDLENAWMKSQGEASDAEHISAPNVTEREVIGLGLQYDYVLPKDIKSITYQVRRRNGQASNINVEDPDTVGNISKSRAEDYGLTLDDIIAVLSSGGARERKRQKSTTRTPQIYD